MANEDVVQEIEEEIKKAKGEPEDFEIEITDDPKEEAKEETEQEDEYGPKVQKESKSSLTKDEKQRFRLAKCKSKMLS